MSEDDMSEKMKKDKRQLIDEVSYEMLNLLADKMIYPQTVYNHIIISNIVVSVALSVTATLVETLFKSHQERKDIIDYIYTALLTTVGGPMPDGTIRLRMSDEPGPTRH